MMFTSSENRRAFAFALAFAFDFTFVFSSIFGVLVVENYEDEDGAANKLSVDLIGDLTELTSRDETNWPFLLKRSELLNRNFFMSLKMLSDMIQCPNQLSRFRRSLRSIGRFFENRGDRLCHDHIGVLTMDQKE